MPFSFLADSNGFLMCNICLIKLTDASLTIAKEERKTKPKKRQKTQRPSEGFSFHHNYSRCVWGWLWSGLLDPISAGHPVHSRDVWCSLFAAVSLQSCCRKLQMKEYKESLSAVRRPQLHEGHSILAFVFHEAIQLSRTDFSFDYLGLLHYQGLSVLSRVLKLQQTTILSFLWSKRKWVKTFHWLFLW